MTLKRYLSHATPLARFVGVASVGFILSACSISEAVHVRKGISPNFADDNVRFRTTYYFRSLDLCEGPENIAENDFGDKVDNTVFIRKKRIDRVLKDTLYRFTMTGKSSPFTKVRFESGTLKSWQIDPFAANVVFDEANNRFYWKPQSEVQREAALGDRMAEIRKMSAFSKELKQEKGEDFTTIIAQIDHVIMERLADLSTASGGNGAFQLVQAIAANLRKTSNEQVSAVSSFADNLVEPANVKKALDKVPEIQPLEQKAQVLAALSRQITGMEADVAYLKEVEKKAKEALDKALKAGQDGNTQTANHQKAEAALKNAEIALATLQFYRGRVDGLTKDDLTADQTGQCAPGSEFRRGFQLIGPEGVKTFDQDDRLVMSMSSSAAPVLGALEELSGRVLKGEATASDQLLPLVQENLHVQKSITELEIVRSASVEDLDDKLQEFITTFKGETE